MREKLKLHIQSRLDKYVYRSKHSGRVIINSDTISQKQEMHERRGADIVKCSATGRILSMMKEGRDEAAIYEIHIRYLVRQKEELYVEEEVNDRYVLWSGDEVVQDYSINEEGTSEYGCSIPPIEEEVEPNRNYRFTYNRMEAVRYAEQWWNTFNPKYKKFDVDCTNYISQCLHAGGAPMVGYPNKSSGWWMRNNSWSYTWTVAHALRWYLPSAKSGIKGKEVSRAEQLKPGDVICYDFQGDGRFDHNTIVVAKDPNGEPLVNAHTYNSRMRYWKYEDSTAYTPNIKYKFFHILDRK
ncbi:amidase domain-containing protein [Sutcliffiella halmapala]|uniref:amidase domain-containing protein n=1 Tax=Sutcliffiella halmapala TaxID=79882 RepID=UPI0009954C94|nr:amidase domain-containing protein [Sutcliffiella halmapala]